MKKITEKKEPPVVVTVRGIVAVNRNGSYRLLASDEAKTEIKLYELLAKDAGWVIEPGEFIGTFETAIKVTFPPAIKVKIPAITLPVSENKNEEPVAPVAPETK